MVSTNVSKNIATVKGEIASEPRNSTPKEKRVEQNKAERLDRFAQLDSTLQPKVAGIEYRVEKASNPTDSQWIGKVGRLVGETPSKNGRETDLLVLQFSADSKDVFSRNQLVEVGGVEPDGFQDIRQKLAEIEDYLSDLRSANKRHKEPDTSAFIEYRTIQAVEALIQTSCLVVGLGERETRRQEAIALLVKLNVIDQAVRVKFRHLITLRNKLAHNRNDIGDEEVIRVLPKLNQVSEQFITGVKAFLEGMTVELLEARLKEVVGSSQSVAMTAKEAAKMLGVEVHCIQRWVRVKRLDGFLFFTGNLLVRRSSVLAMYNTLPQWYRAGMP